MEQTGDSKARCWDLVDRFFVMKYLPPGSRERQARMALSNTLLNACTSMAVAEEVVESVVNYEEHFPAPATLRQYLRDLGYIEADVSDRHDREMRAATEALAREAEERIRMLTEDASE